MIVYGNSSLLFIAITFLISLALVLLLTKALDLLFCTSSVAVPIIFYINYYHTLFSSIVGVHISNR